MALPAGGRVLIDGLQYCNWSQAVFEQMQAGGVTAVHATIAYHESFREMVGNLARWSRRFELFPHLIFHGRTGEDVRRAAREGRTAIFLGFQNPSPIEDDIGLVEVCHALGVRFMQLSYNNQSLLATGWCEAEDPGVTRMGRDVIGEMNRVGLVIDMSHSAERSTLQAIELSARPIAISHANPSAWHPVMRNKSDAVLRALGQSGGMLGFSLYPNHLAGGSQCALDDFCSMVARTAEIAGTGCLGIGSDLCQDQPPSVLAWMRSGRWSKDAGSAVSAGFPPQPSWFRSNLDFGTIANGLAAVGFSRDEVDGIMGLNWLDFFDRSFGPQGAR